MGQGSRRGRLDDGETVDPRPTTGPTGRAVTAANLFASSSSATSDDEPTTPVSNSDDATAE